MEQLKIVMPMAGRGQRFKSKGIVTPKPIIDVLGAPMIKWATRSLSFFDKIPNDNIIAVVRKEDIKFHQIDEKLHEIFPNIKILIDENPQGAVNTTLVARDYIETDDPLLIMDCDLYFRSKQYERIIIEHQDIDGAIPVFIANGDKWSFSTFGNDHIIREVTEKKRVVRKNLNTYANIGFYFFSKGKEFVYYSDTIIAKKRTQRGEYYISLVIDEMVKAGRKILAVACDEVSNFGTPEDLQDFISSRC